MSIGAAALVGMRIVNSFHATGTKAILVGVTAAVVITSGLVFFSVPAPEIARGAKLYSVYCVSCHGANLQGEPNWQSPKPTGRMPAPPHDETGHTWHHADRDLFLITKKGMAAVVPGYSSDMPVFDGVLSDDEINAILAYIKSRWPAEARRYQDERTRLKP